jgi:uncharacterized repeat protein (TIGR01451 family)
MKRILIRLSALAAVVTLGVFAVAQAQRGLRPADEQDPAADLNQAGSTAGDLATGERDFKDSLDSAPKPADRYTSAVAPHDGPAHDRPSSTDPFASSWRSGARDRGASAHDATAIAPQPLDEVGRDPMQDAAGAAAVAGDEFPDAASALHPRNAEGAGAAPPNPLDTGVVAAGYDAASPRSGRGAAADLKARGSQPAKGAPGEPTLAPPQGSPDERYPGPPDRGTASVARAGAKSAATDTRDPAASGQPGLGQPDLLARGADRSAGREPAPLDLPHEGAARQIEGPAAGADNFAPPAAAAAEGQTEGAGRPGGKQLEGPQTPTLTVEKSAPQEVQVGKPAVFQIVVRNTGQTPALAVEVRDQIPKGTQLVSTTPRAAQTAQGDLHWSLGTIKPGEEASLQMELMPLTEGEIGSVATVHFAAESSVRATATKPQLVLEVKAQPEVMIGDEITFSIKLSNPGSGAATGVLLQEAVPEALEHEAGPELEYDVGELKPGETRQLELTMKAVKAGRFTNALFARGEGAARAECKSEIEIIAPALELQIEGPKRRYLDRQATYTVSVSNPGTAAATKVGLLTHLPPGLKFVEANNEGRYDAQTRSVHWLLEQLPANEMGSVTLTVLPVEAGEQPVQVESTADRGLSAKREQLVVVEGVSAILFTVADVADPVEVGGETTYEIKVVNQGTKAATNLQLVALLPAEMKPLSGEGPSRYVVDGQRVLFDPLPQLAPKADTTFKVKAQGLRAGDVRVSVQLLTDEMRTPVTKEESTKIYADE